MHLHYTILTLFIFFCIPMGAFLQVNSDVGFEKGDVLVPPVSSDYYKMFDGFPIGGTFYNYGTNDQDSVYISVNITDNNGYQFNDTIGPLTLVSGDSIRVFDGEPNSFTTFITNPNSFNPGAYTLNYQIDINNDENTSNNSITFPFALWMNQYNTIAPSGVLPNEERLHQTYPKPDTALSYQACVVWEDPNEIHFASNPYSYVMSDVDFVAHVDSGQLLAGAEIFVNVYDWSDPWLDLNDTAFLTQNGAFQNLQLLGFGTYYPQTESENNTTITVPLQSFVFPNDYTRYLVCAQTFETPVKFGFDTTTNFRTNFNEIRQPIGIIQSNSDWHIVEPNMVPSIAPRFALISGIDESQLNVLEVFPNPSQEALTVKMPTTGSWRLYISDLQGRQVKGFDHFSDGNNITINTRDFASGVYVVALEFASGNRFSQRFQKQ